VDRLSTKRGRGSRGTRRAFTLVELITATALMTIMMMGIVQIFSVITETAARAQGFQFFQEQGRAVLNRMDLDFRGFTREGYLRIVTAGDKDGTNQPAFTFSTPTAAVTLPNSGYTSDLLAMTTVGPATGAWHTSPAAPTALASEVVYTRKVKTPDNMLQIKVGSVTSTLDDRRGILGRGIWLLTPGAGSGTGTGTDTDDLSKAKYLGNLANDPATVDRWTRTDNSLAVWPMIGVGTTASTNPQSLQRVAASCDSEFLVEYLAWIKDPSPTGSAYNYYWVRANQDYKNTPRANFPRAIRITLAIHDPDDHAPLTGTMKRYQGYALQEVFWLGDP
jgi:type II secretory pathway pseudopilin PulG